MEKRTFEEDMNSDWEFDTCYETEDFHIMNEEGVVAEVPRVWGRHKPGCFDYNNEDYDKMVMLFLNANKLYKLVEGLDSEEAKALIEKINTGDPEDYRVDYEERGKKMLNDFRDNQ